VVDDLDVGQERREIEGVEVGLDDPQEGLLDDAEILPLEPRVVVVGQDVDAHHVVPLVEEPASERAADEPGDAGDEGLHAMHRPESTALASIPAAAGTPIRTAAGPFPATDASGQPSGARGRARSTKARGAQYVGVDEVARVEHQRSADHAGQASPVQPAPCRPRRRHRGPAESPR
jgi:hypothetical protein